MINVPTRVKDALKSGMYPKNHRIVVLDEENAELFTIDNTSLVDGSVSYDERLCTGDTLKFGLCEGSSLQFQYFGHESILGRRLQCFIDAQYKDADGELKYFEIPMGFYDVEQCPMQFDTGIKKVTAYNKLKSKYLDEKVNETIQTLQTDIANENNITIGSIVDSLLEGFKIEPLKTYESIGKRNRETDGYLCNIPFKVKGTTQNRYLMIDYFTIEYTWSSTRKAKADISNYLKILSDLLDEVHEIIEAYMQTPSTAWNSFVNSGLYQLIQARASYGDVAEPNIYYLFEKPTTKWSSDVKAFEDITKLEYLYGFSKLQLRIPIALYIGTATTSTGTWTEVWNTDRRITIDTARVVSYDVTEVEAITINKTNVPDVTLRDLQSAMFEMQCQFGQLNRETDLFSGISLSNERLFPSESLYPSDNLYPGGKAEHIMRSNYEKLWTDAQGIQKFKELIITYKGLNDEGQEEEKTLTRTIDADGTQNYNMSDNWLFKNLVWTAEEVGHYADAMVEKMRNVTWFPFEMWAAGLPYIETGDELEITTQSGTYTSYVLTRTLNGIHDLHDTYINGTLDVF